MHYTKTMQSSVGCAGVGFTGVDAAMTAGYMLLTIPVWFMAPVYAFFAALGAVVIAILPMLGAVAWARGVRVVAILCWLVWVPAFALNFTWNFGITATMLETNIKEGRVKQTVTGDLRDDIKRLKDRDDELTATINMRPTVGGETWLEPNAYDKLITAKRLQRENEEKQRGGCGIKCEAFENELRSLEAAKVNAIARQAKIEERRKIRADLIAAKSGYKEQDKGVSEAEAQARLISRVLTGQVKPEDVTVDWTMIWLSLGASLFVSVMASLCNLVYSLNLAGVHHHEENAHAQRYQQARYIGASPEFKPNPVPEYTPLREHTSSVTVNYQGANRPSVDRLMAMISEFEAKAN